MMPKRTRPPKVAPTMVVVLRSLDSRVASKVLALVVAVVALVAAAAAAAAGSWEVVVRFGSG